MAGTEDQWRKNAAADTHKNPAGGHNPTAGGIRRSMPYNPYAMAAAGLAVVVGGLWYYYGQRRPEAGRSAEPDDLRHRK